MLFTNTSYTIILFEGRGVQGEEEIRCGGGGGEGGGGDGEELEVLVASVVWELDPVYKIS